MDGEEPTRYEIFLSAHVNLLYIDKNGTCNCSKLFKLYKKEYEISYDNILEFHFMCFVSKHFLNLMPLECLNNKSISFFVLHNPKYFEKINYDCKCENLTFFLKRNNLENMYQVYFGFLTKENMSKMNKYYIRILMLSSIFNVTYSEAEILYNDYNTSSNNDIVVGSILSDKKIEMKSLVGHVLYATDFNYYARTYIKVKLIKYIHPLRNRIEYKYNQIINDPVKFYPFSNRESGGIYFSYDCKEFTTSFPKKFTKRYVTLPDSAYIYFDKPSGVPYYQFKTDQIILTK